MLWWRGLTMKKPGNEGMRIIVRQPESKRVAIERRHALDGLRGIDVEHHVSEPERPGAKAGNRAAGLERLRRRLGAMKKLEPVALRIVEHDQIRHVPFVGQRAGAAGYIDPRALELPGQRIERGRVPDLPTEKADALAVIGVDDDPLLAVVHAEGQRGARFVDALKAEQTRAVARPIAQILGSNPDITESLRNHFFIHDKSRAIVTNFVHRCPDS